MPRPATLALQGLVNSRTHVPPAALTFVKEGATLTTAGSTGVSTGTVSPANTIGNLVVMNIVAKGNSAGQTVTHVGTASTNVDPGGNTWALFGAQTNGFVRAEQWWTVTSAVCGAVVVTMTGNCSLTIDCLEFSGNASGAITDKQAEGSGNSTTALSTIGSATVHANDVSVACVGCQSGSITSPSGTYTSMTQLSSTDTGAPCAMMSGYKILAATGTQQYGATVPSGVWVVVLGTYKGL